MSRRAFYEQAQKQLHIAARQRSEVAIIVADLDGFKSVNDTFGHLVGDNVLKHISDIIKENIRESDFAGRVGGDEFVFCLTQSGREEAEHFGQRLLKNVLTNPHSHEGADIGCGISLGVSIISPTKKNSAASDLETIIHQADTALYTAKRMGKNRLRFA